MAYNNIDFGYHPVGAPTCLHKQVVKPSLNAAQSYAKAEGCVHDDLPGLRNCARAGPLGLVPEMLTHLQEDQVN